MHWPLSDPGKPSKTSENLDFDGFLSQCYQNSLMDQLHFYHMSTCEGSLGSRNSVHLTVCPSVCLSVTRVDILIPHEWAITLLL